MWRLVEADSDFHPQHCRCRRRRRCRRRPTQTNNRYQSVSAPRVVAAQWLLSSQRGVHPDQLPQPLSPGLIVAAAVVVVV